jgi:hypothetical protein
LNIEITVFVFKFSIFAHPPADDPPLALQQSWRTMEAGGDQNNQTRSRSAEDLLSGRDRRGNFWHNRVIKTS